MSHTSPRERATLDASRPITADIRSALARIQAGAAVCASCRGPAVLVRWGRLLCSVCARVERQLVRRDRMRSRN